MNTAQRKFLTERIQQKVKDKIWKLEETMLRYPSASNYIFKSAMNDTLKLQPQDVILKAIKEKALKAKEGSNWLSDQTMGLHKENEIRLSLEDVIVLPQDFKEEVTLVNTHNNLVRAEINALKIQLETIEVRVQLASDSVLQKLVNEVDDMGSLSLIDTKLKLITK